jgi:hypothetical protein
MRRKLQSYDPYNSFLSDGQRFLDKDGKPTAWFGTSDRDDVLQLWRLGRDAFQALGEFEDRAEYDSFFADHLAGIQIFADALNDEGNHLDFQNEDGVSWKPNFSEAQSFEILNVFWQLTNSKGELYEPLGHHFLLACLEEIDFALVGLALNTDHLHAVISAVRAFGNYQAIATGNNDLQQARSELAFRAAKEKHAQDPKQAEKTFVFECWEEWQEHPEKYKGKAAFARDMLNKCEKLESQKVIEDWCRQWERTYKL